MLSFATVNGLPLVSARICLPREGQWHGELAIEDDSFLAVGLELNINGATFQASAVRSNIVEGTGVAHFVAGAGGLGRPIKPKMYRNVALKIPLGDILAAAGETLAASAQADVLGLQLGSWTMLGGKCGAALQALVELGAGASWRYLTDGTIWVGQESWESISADGEVLTEDVLMDRAVLYLETPELVPGRTFNGRRISYVEHELRESRLRTTAWFERGGAA